MTDFNSSPLAASPVPSANQPLPRMAPSPAPEPSHLAGGGELQRIELQLERVMHKLEEIERELKIMHQQQSHH